MRKPTGLLLALGVLVLGVTAQAQDTSQPATLTAKAAQQRQDWQNPISGERVTLQFDGQQTTLTRGGKSVILPLPAYNAAADLARTREMLKEHFRWNMLSVPRWRDQFISNAHSVAEAKKAFVAQGFPLKLWDDIDEFLKASGQPVPKGGPPEIPDSYAATLSADGTLTVSHFKDGKPSETVFQPTDPQWQDNLLIHPTPELRARYENLYLTVPIKVSPPTADTPFNEQARRLQEGGFVRLTSRDKTGGLWLPEPLVPYRTKLQASERPVVQLAADPKRVPKLWESKVGGVPYRLRGIPWPMSTEKHSRPLVFLVQLNLSEINAGAKALPDLPSKGLLQFFILNTETMGADSTFEEGGSKSGLEGNYRVLYLPAIIRDTAKLDTSVPKPEYDPAEVGQLKAAGYLSLIEDSHLIWDKLPFEQLKSYPPPAIALNYVVDHEPVSGVDNQAATVLGKNPWEGSDVGTDLASKLYDLSVGGHKVGGYPNFTQSDPRQNPAQWTLLFQLDSDPALKLMWGDVGTANFFIRPTDLKKLDFSHVVYHWDCG